MRRLVGILHTKLWATVLIFAWPAGSAVLAAPAYADPRQQPAEQFRIGVEVNMVAVPVTVRRPGGAFVKGLQRAAFRVKENGRGQEIVTFAQEGVPLRLAILLDTSSSVYSEWADIAESTQKFVEQLKPTDKFALVTFNQEVRLRLDWGHHADKIRPVLASITCEGRTSLWDALWVTSRNLLRDIRERKAIILMTDGLDNTSSIKFDEMLDAAIRSETTVYVVSKTEAVRSAALNNKNLWTKDFTQADLSLRRLAEETGGRVLYLDPASQLDAVYREVYEELHSQYTIGYISNNKSDHGMYRRIQVLVDERDAVVSARPGYLPEVAAGRPAEGTSGVAVQDISRAVMPAESRPSRAAAAPDPQKKHEEFKIGVEVNLVTVPVTVRRPDGGFLKGLPRSAVRVLEDGHEQEIVSFAQEAVPAHIAILLDTSGSARSEWGAIKITTKRFASHLQPADQFARVTFNEQVRLRVDWGNRTEALDSVLGSIYCTGTTNLWDALWLTGNDVFKPIQGKKAVIVMTDGLDNNSSIAFDEMLDAATRSEAMFYVVGKTEAVRQSMLRDMAQRGNFRDLPVKPFMDAERNLVALAEETGGRMLRPDSFGQIGNVYEEVYEELRNQYLIGYISNNPSRNSGYRHIQVVVDQPRSMVYARPGCFASNQLPQITANPESRVPDSTAMAVLKGSLLRAYVDHDTYLNNELVRAINASLAVEKPPELAVSRERAVVHIYGKDYQLGLRPSFNVGVRYHEKLGKPAVFLDGNEVARIAQNRFLTIEVAAGKHTFKTDRGQIELDLQEGQEVYLRVTSEGLFWPKGHLRVAALEEGEEEMYPLAPTDAKDVQEPWRTQLTAQIGLASR